MRAALSLHGRVFVPVRTKSPATLQPTMHAGAALALLALVAAAMVATVQSAGTALDLDGDGIRNGCAPLRPEGVGARRWMWEWVPGRLAATSPAIQRR